MLSQNQKHEHALREQWKLKGPTGFAAQEARRKLYSKMKKKGEIVKSAVAMPALACKMFLDSESETFYDEPSIIDDPCISWSLGADSGCQTPQFWKTAAE